MIDTGITIKLYEFEEISKEAKQRAIDEHREFLLSIMMPEDFISGEAEFDTEEQLQKTYKKQYDYYLENDEPVIENIKANEYWFFEDGELPEITTYCGKSPLSGETHLKLYGKDYLIKKV